MQIEFLQKKPFYIFKIENFLNDEEYQTLEENFPSNENKATISGQDEGSKEAFDNRDESYKDLLNKKNIAINILEKKFDEKFCLELFSIVVFATIKSFLRFIENGKKNENKIKTKLKIPVK